VNHNRLPAPYSSLDADLTTPQVNQLLTDCDPSPLHPGCVERLLPWTKGETIRLLIDGDPRSVSAHFNFIGAVNGTYTRLQHTWTEPLCVNFTGCLTNVHHDLAGFGKRLPCKLRQIVSPRAIPNPDVSISLAANEIDHAFPSARGKCCLGQFQISEFDPWKSRISLLRSTKIFFPGDFQQYGIVRVARHTDACRHRPIIPSPRSSACGFRGSFWLGTRILLHLPGVHPAFAPTLLSGCLLRRRNCNTWTPSIRIKPPTPQKKKP